MRERAIFFDLDDTLYSFQTCNAAAEDASVAYLRENFGYEGDRERYHREIYHQMDLMAERLGIDNSALHSRTLRNAMLLQEMGQKPIPHAGILEDIYWKVTFENLLIEPGIKDLLTEIHQQDIFVGVATNLTAHPQYKKIYQLGLADLVTEMIPSEVTGFEKPSRGFYEYCLQRADAAPENCIFIGDNLEHDVLGPRALGMQGILYAPPHLPMDPKASALVKEEGIPVIRDYREPKVRELLDLPKLDLEQESYLIG